MCRRQMGRAEFHRSSVRNNNNDDDKSLSNKTSPASTGGNSAIASLGKSIEKHGQTLVDIAKNDAKEKEKDRLDKKKERNHTKQLQLNETLRKLEGEKRSLLIQYAEEVGEGEESSGGCNYGSGR